MDQKEFARTLAERTGLSREESADLARATLERLGEQLSASEAQRLAARLDDSLAQPLRGRNRRSQAAHPVPVDEFIRQVSGRTGLKPEETRSGVGAVLSLLREMLSEDDYRHLTGQLRAGFSQLAQSAP